MLLLGAAMLVLTVSCSVAGGTVDSRLVGTWRQYSARYDYDAGGAAVSDTPLSDNLVIKPDGTWSYGTSKGSISSSKLTPDDTKKWGGMSDVQIKVVLNGWEKGTAEGPVQESGGRVNFIWVIYRVTSPRPGTVSLKFGH